ncbi:MAG: PKD domain-containing protein [Chthoniobacterales bacterium]|nr:PKD domain-containing protein [Chthoniobacterales bacterium]
MNNTSKIIGAFFALVLIAVAVPTAFTAPAVTLTASVVDQQCQGGDFVNVTLTAALNPARSGVTYAWDFDNDGVLDTEPSSDPTVSHLYPDEESVTARVQVTKGRRSLSDTVTFGTLRCGN